MNWRAQFSLFDRWRRGARSIGHEAAPLVEVHRDTLKPHVPRTA
jgi:hypothetical protein